MQDRRIIVTVPGDKYKVLAEKARIALRSPEQHASWLLRRLLDQAVSEPVEATR
jgi:hypothetical protein